tara:strand:+ start:1124 stop:1429 length:306 start_codon:yes stop_codon:yes gene_type:complete
MTFSGGGSNLTLSHTHDGNIVNDGGSLNMKNITQGALSSGSITYSDGNHLQELLVGTPTNVLTISAGNLPVWSAAPGVSCSSVLVINGQSRTLCEWLELGV